MTRNELLSANDLLQKEIAKHCNNERKLRKRIVESVNAMLDKLGGDLTFGDYSDDDIYICYDGGNHIEYASNMNERVEVVKVSEYMGEKSFKVNVVKEHNIDQSRLIFDDVLAIYDYVLHIYAG